MPDIVASWRRAKLGDELDLDATVAKYWPEFAVQGRAHVKVRHLLAHTSEYRNA